MGETPAITRRQWIYGWAAYIVMRGSRLFVLHMHDPPSVPAIPEFAIFPAISGMYWLRTGGTR
jgi:hypothetical protein